MLLFVYFLSLGGDQGGEGSLYLTTLNHSLVHTRSESRSSMVPPLLKSRLQEAAISWVSVMGVFLLLYLLSIVVEEELASSYSTLLEGKPPPLLDPGGAPILFNSRPQRRRWWGLSLFGDHPRKVLPPLKSHTGRWHSTSQILIVGGLPGERYWREMRNQTNNNAWWNTLRKKWNARSTTNSTSLLLSRASKVETTRM